MGTDKEVFGVSLDIERKVLMELCQAGISLEMQRESADAVVEATALPGTYAIDPVDGGTEDVLASLTEAVLGAGTAGTRAVDESRQKRAKTAMISVRTAADLGVAVEELAEVMEPVLEQMENDVRNTLDVLCWDEDQVEAYLVSGRLPLLSRWIVQLYHKLLLNFVQGVSKHGCDLVQIDMAFYTRALINLRAMARRRFPFILTYVFLRDARHEGWTPPKLVKARTTYTSKVLVSIQTRLQVGTLTCSYCLSRTLHAGSHASCPFKSKTKTVARQLRSWKPACPSLLQSRRLSQKQNNRRGGTCRPVLRSGRKSHSAPNFICVKPVLISRTCALTD